jgi:trehalose 6-phosphate phosphatase
LEAATFFAVFLDFDGTLVNFRRRPGDVRLAPKAKSVIERLVGHTNIFVAIVSGRRLRDLQQLVDIAGLQYAGLHGREGIVKSAPLSTQSGRALAEVKHSLQRQLQGLEKVWIEDKGDSFAVHYRGAGSTIVKSARETLLSVVASSGVNFRVLDGSCVWEVLPPEVPGKSAAVEQILTALPSGIPVVYVGDDGTDETAFEALRNQITIRVGRSPKTQAHYHLHGPADVIRFLERLERILH